MQDTAPHREDDQSPETIAAFYDRSVGEVFAYFYRATAGNRQLAEDLTQETFEAWGHVVVAFASAPIAASDTFIPEIDAMITSMATLN